MAGPDICSTWAKKSRLVTSRFVTAMHNGGSARALTGAAMGLIDSRRSDLTSYRRNAADEETLAVHRGPILSN